MVVILCAVYYCLKYELCCVDKKEDEYTRLQLASEEVESDQEFIDRRSALVSHHHDVVIEAEVDEVKTIEHLDEKDKFLTSNDVEKAALDDTDGDRSSLRTVSAYGERIRRKDAGISKCGQLHIKVEFTSQKSKLSVTVIEAKEIPSKDRGGAPQASVHVVLLPGKKHRYKTKAKPSADPVYNETTVFNKIKEEDMYKQALRFRIYGIKGGKEKLVGETVLQLADVASATAQVVQSWRIISAAKPET